MSSFLVNKSLVQLKKEPFCESETVDEVIYGMSVTVIGTLCNGWLLVRTFYGYEGYVKSGCLIEDKEPGHRREWVLGSYMDVLEKPDIKSRCMATLVRGSIVKVLIRESNGYTEILLNDGRIGYIKSSGLLKMYMGWVRSDEKRIRKDLVQTALSYLGTQYRWGGKSPMGIDCSGLCSMAYMLNGINIWRDAKLHKAYPVKEIEPACMKPGDLLYFPGHMAMYIGEQCYVHSSNQMGSDGVVLNSLNPEADNYRKDLASNILFAGSVF